MTPAPRQRVVFTALPNGLVPGQPGKYRLSVHIAPQLRGEADWHLDKFPDWAHWPTTVNAIGWKVAVGAAPPVTAMVASAPAQLNLWTALFGNALVQPPTPPAVAERKVRSYPARNVTEYLRKHYTDTALASPEDWPHIDDLFQFLGDVDPTVLNGSTVAAAVEQQLVTQRVVYDGAPLANPKVDFYQLVRFHRSRFNVKQYDNVPLPPVAKPALDFHQAVTTVGQYPPLMRLLGLVVDLVLDLSGGLPVPANQVRVVPTWTPAVPPNGNGTGTPTADFATPRTQCILDGGQFRPRPRPVVPDLADGRLKLEDADRYALLEVDQDGAGLKLVDFAGNLARFRFGRSDASPSNYALPSLRSAGLAVSRSNRASALHDRLGRNAAASTGLSQEGTPADVALFAEDVTRGHRVDIWDAREAKWFSLSARTGTYRFPGGVNVPFADENWTTAGVTEDDTPDQDLYVQETLFRWGGWSLAAERPGGRLSTAEQSNPPVTTAPVAGDPNFPVTVDAKATPGTLPRLRFGRTFSVRARAVDLAGNSDALNPTIEDRHKTPPVDYLRYEPVAAPPVLPHDKRTEGESLERVVLRSNYQPALDPSVTASRHIAPPKSDQLLAEQHGMFDSGYPGSIVRANAYPVISKYPGPTPPDPLAPVVQTEQGNFLNSSEASFDLEDDHPKAPYFNLDLVTLPYLPDPMAVGASLVFLDHPAVPARWRLPVPFAAAAWPAYKAVRLVVSEGTGAPTYDAAHRHVNVPLGKADVVRVRLSSFFRAGDEEKFGVWQWMKAAGGGAMLSTVQEGRHWMLTPYRVLTLVHAVRQPLKIAQFQPLNVFKAAGQTFVTFGGAINLSRKSTSRVDIVAEWDEFVDRGPGAPKPTAPGLGSDYAPQARRAIPFSIPGDRAGFPDLASLDVATDNQEFGDTRHRQVRYTTVATTKFAEYFVERVNVTVNFGGGDSQVVVLPTGNKGLVARSVAVKNKLTANKQDGTVTGARTYTEGTDFTVDYKAGTVKLLKAGGCPPGQPVTIAFLVPPIVRGPGEPEMVPAVRSIKSSAPPDAPKVLYVVPTFGWESSKGPQVGNYDSRRRGKGLRVYLERPWWSSGEGELLAVILDCPNSPDTPERVKAVSRVAADPVFKSGAASALGVFSFPLAKATGLGPSQTGLAVPGLDGTTVFAVGHDVGYDPDRQLWYCDIVINTGSSYFPFVKLGLARYQPESVPGLELSPIVVTDFCQLTPDRFVTVRPALGLQGVVARVVTVTGPTYEKVGGDTQPPILRVFVERLDATINNDLGWTQVGATTTLIRQPDQGSDAVWSAQITIPSSGGAKQRLVIEEHERHRTGGTPVFDERIVFSDIIDL